MSTEVFVIGWGMLATVSCGLYGYWAPNDVMSHVPRRVWRVLFWVYGLGTGVAILVVLDRSLQ